MSNSGAAPECVSVSAYGVRSATGYNHIVRIDNQCDADVQCQVATDVAPDPIDARVHAHDRADLTTYRGWTTHSFVPDVNCE